VKVFGGYDESEYSKGGSGSGTKRVLRMGK